MKTVLITGCSSGFGHALVRSFLEKGWKVIATMRNTGGRSLLFASERNQYGERLEICELDVTSKTDRAETVRILQTKYASHLDLLINNAGFGLFGALEDLSEEQIQRQIDVNFLGLVYLTRALLPFLRESQGRIINLSSFFGVSTAPQNSMYCASKFALEGFSEALRFELQPFGVQVALVEPGATKTQFGQNVVWGERSLDPRSPYAFQTANYQGIKERIGSRAPDQSGVIRVILKLAHMRKMPLRNFTGRDARSMRRLMRFLPETIYLGLLSIVFSRTFSKKTTKELRANHA
jgi:NAD(P)-dependent dehydrogenase (short-subunit alcohol dehydrogenase family)